MPVTKTYNCGICKANVVKSQLSVQCKKCLLWFHYNCSGLPNKAFAAYYNCPPCAGICVGVANGGADAVNPASNLVFNSAAENNVVATDCNAAATRQDLNQLSDKLDVYFKKFEAEYADLKRSFGAAVADLNDKFTSGLEVLRNEIVDCRKLVNYVDSASTNKIAIMEAEMNSLHRRLNRGDVVISGLPSALNDLKSVISSVCQFYNVQLSDSAIQQVFYMSNKKLVMVRFNDISVRDKLMSEYFKSRNLKLCNVIGGDIQNRVFLNDHLTPAAGKLNSLCRKLLQKRVVTRYRVLNGDKLLARLTLSNGKEVTFSAEGCADLLSDAAPETI